MKIERFEDIISWQKALELTVEIYKIFEQSKDFSFKDQMEFPICKQIEIRFR